MAAPETVKTQIVMTPNFDEVGFNVTTRPIDHTDVSREEEHYALTQEGSEQPQTSSVLTPEEAERFGAEFAKLQPELYHYARKLTSNHDDAEDLVQETFLKAMPNYKNFNDDGRGLAPFLVRIAQNIRIDRARKEKRIDIFPSSHLPVAAQGPRNVLSPIPEVPYWSIPAPSPEDIIVNREHTRSLFTKWVGEIGTRQTTKELVQRSIASLYLDSAGFKDEEIGDILGAPVSTIRTGNRRFKKHVQNFESKKLVSV
ncbi:RNA polymerase sigma factor [Aeromicrobium sp.]|nr:RNA polymerase sigma factor [Candidatus Saccharibacteria bacterium]